MKKKYFGTDGIRGKVGQHPITPDFMIHLANATGQFLKQRFNKPTVLIAKDTRVSGYMIESSLEAGFCSAGVDVILCGPLPTAGVAYLTRALRLQLGVVISASHNPFDDNGVKFFSAHGLKLNDYFELEIEARLAQPMVFEPLMLGKVRRLDDALGRYVEFCKSTFEHDQLNDFSIMVDCANGSAYQVAPMVFRELGADVKAIFNQPDGFNINLNCGAVDCMQLQNEMRAIEKNQRLDALQAHHVGIALDGDADRLQIIDNDGRLYTGDELLYLLALYYTYKGKPPTHVVGTLMTNCGIEQALLTKNIKLIRANVGDRYILEQLQKHHLNLGAEGSGHILCFDKHSTGDGIIAALQVLSTIKCLGPLSQLLKDVHLQQQILVNVKLPYQKIEIEQLEKFQMAIQKNQQILEQQGGRLLIRKSGTEPKLRIMVESPDSMLANDIAQQLKYICEQEIHTLA